MWNEEGDYLRTLSFDLDHSIDRVIKTIVRKANLKSDAKDISLWYNQGADMEELTDPEQELSAVGVKNFDLVYLMPKKSVKVSLPSGTTEELHVDFSTYTINVLSILADVLGWEDIEDYLLIRMVPGKEPQGEQ